MRPPLKSMIFQKAIYLVLAFQGSFAITVAASEGEADGTAPLQSGESGGQILQNLLSLNKNHSLACYKTWMDALSF